MCVLGGRLSPFAEALCTAFAVTNFCIASHIFLMGYVAGGYMSLHWALLAEYVQLTFTVIYFVLGIICWCVVSLQGGKKRASGGGAVQPGDKNLACGR